MKLKAVTRHIRLLPAVMVLAASLLAVKGTDLAWTARAEAAPASDPAGTGQDQPKAAKPAASVHASKPDAASADASHAYDPALDDASTSAAEVDVLTSLSKRRAELDARAKALDMRANLLAAAEKRVDTKIQDLKSLEKQIQGLLGQRDEAEKQQVVSLVKVYSSMKARDAARIFNSLDQSVLLDVARTMKPDVLAAIMAAMQPQEAQDLTVKLANRLKLPQKADLATPAQIATDTAVVAPPSPATGG